MAAPPAKQPIAFGEAANAALVMDRDRATPKGSGAGRTWAPRPHRVKKWLGFIGLHWGFIKLHWGFIGWDWRVHWVGLKGSLGWTGGFIGWDWGFIGLHWAVPENFFSGVSGIGWNSEELLALYPHRVKKSFG